MPGPGKSRRELSKPSRPPILIAVARSGYLKAILLQGFLDLLFRAFVCKILGVLGGIACVESDVCLSTCEVSKLVILGYKTAVLSGFGLQLGSCSVILFKLT